MMPEDARAFVANAESAFNERDLQAAMSCYSEDAILECWTDGIYEAFHGPDQIAKAWTAIFEIFPQFRLKKSFSYRDEAGGIVNEWKGRMYGHRRSFGMEIWHFNASGQVVNHKLITFNNVLPSRSWRGQLRWMLTHPGLAWRTLRVRKKLGL